MEDVAFQLPFAGITLRGRRTGSRTGQPTLCLHGWLDNCASFEPMLERMNDLNLIAVDLPGHGMSDPLPSPTCQILDYVACLLELAQTQGWERFRLIGHSVGAALAALMAGTHPEKVTSLVLLDAVLPHAVDPDEGRTSLTRYLTAYLTTAWEQTPVHRTRRQATKVRVQSGDILLNTAERLVERDLKEVPGGYTWRTDGRLRLSFMLSLTAEQLRAFLRNISAPTLLVTAERTLGEEFYPSRLDDVPCLRQVSLAGGHYLHMENVDPVVAVIREFLGVESLARCGP